MNGFSNYWNSLSPGLREAIVAGIISTIAATIILGVLKLSGGSIRAGFRRIFGRTKPAPIHDPPPRQEFTFKFEGLQPAQQSQADSQSSQVTQSSSPDNVTLLSQTR